MFDKLKGAIGSLLSSETAKAPAGYNATRSGLMYVDVELGKGLQPRVGENCVVHYIGWLYEGGKKGKMFDSTIQRGKPFMFQYGKGKVIKGWDEGVATMRAGGRRNLIVPPVLAYGEAGLGKAIPPNATLFFELALMEVK